MDNIKKSCENCHFYSFISRKCDHFDWMGCTNIEVHPYWQPNYSTLLAQNAILIALLEKIKPNNETLECENAELKKELEVHKKAIHEMSLIVDCDGCIYGCGGRMSECVGVYLNQARRELQERC